MRRLLSPVLRVLDWSPRIRYAACSFYVNPQLLIITLMKKGFGPSGRGSSPIQAEVGEGVVKRDR